jgi:hypothetical protein
MRLPTPQLKVPPGYLKAKDIIQHGFDVYEFVCYTTENERTYHARAIRQSDGQEKRIILHKKTRIAVLNDSAKV